MQSVGNVSAWRDNKCDGLIESFINMNPVFQHVPLFGNRTTADIISYDEGSSLIEFFVFKSAFLKFLMETCSSFFCETDSTAQNIFYPRHKCFPLWAWLLPTLQDLSTELIGIKFSLIEEVDPISPVGSWSCVGCAEQRQA